LSIFLSLVKVPFRICRVVDTQLQVSFMFPNTQPQKAFENPSI
jgi:hypothetical protein